MRDENLIALVEKKAEAHGNAKYYYSRYCNSLFGKSSYWAEHVRWATIRDTLEDEIKKLSSL